MRKILLAAVLIAMAAPVQAADMPVKAPAAVLAPVYDWTGLYIGVHAGGAWNRGNSTDDPLPSVAAFNRSVDFFDLNASGGLAGVHAGYNWLYSNILLGVEADWSWTHNSASATAPIRDPTGVPFVSGTTTMGRDLDWLASARLRAGVPFNNNLLLYATGGVAAGGLHYTGMTTNAPLPALFTWAADQRQTEFGFVVGGGGEWGLTPNVILRAEYLFYRLNGQSTTVSGAPLFTGFDIHYNWNSTDTHVARVAVSYKFGAH